MARALLRRWLPDAATLRASRWLRWLGPLLERPWLWQVNRRGIAMGFAIGLFIGLLIPFGQALLAGAAAVWLRANLAAAVLATLVSNPLTTPLILIGAYHVGAALLDAPPDPPGSAPEAGWMDRALDMGEPLLVGLLVVSSAAAVLGYASVIALWRVSSLLRLRRKQLSARARM